MSALVNMCPRSGCITFCIKPSNGAGWREVIQQAAPEIFVNSEGSGSALPAIAPRSGSTFLSRQTASIVSGESSNGAGLCAVLVAAQWPRKTDRNRVVAPSRRLAVGARGPAVWFATFASASGRQGGALRSAVVEP